MVDLLGAQVDREGPNSCSIDEAIVSALFLRLDD